jgi:hypothetical protein
MSYNYTKGFLVRIPIKIKVKFEATFGEGRAATDVTWPSTLIQQLLRSFGEWKVQGFLKPLTGNEASDADGRPHTQVGCIYRRRTDSI